MALLPDRFDLWVRQARTCPDPARQLDLILGALLALKDWTFISANSKSGPLPAETLIEGSTCVLVFSDQSHLEDALPPGESPRDSLPAITIPSAAALDWCAQHGTGLLVNPGEYAALIPFASVQAFHAEWHRRGGRKFTGFWIPNLTTAEEDFWQEHGL